MTKERLTLVLGRRCVQHKVVIAACRSVLSILRTSGRYGSGADFVCAAYCSESAPQ